MFENEVKLVRILSHAGVKGNFNNPYQNDALSRFLLNKIFQ